jgi:hypothetical protein
MGFAIAKHSPPKARWIMVNCHSEPRIAQAIAFIRADSPTARLEVFALDLFNVEASIRNRSNGFWR